MSFAVRAAPPAVLFLCAALLAGTSAPGLARQAQESPFPASNAAIPQQEVPPIPADEPVAPPSDAALAEIGSAQEEAAPVAEPARNFTTLAAAVAAQDADADTRELECLAAGVYYESNGEPLAGQLAVAQVILARTTSGRFPKSVCSVLTQRGQFSFVRGGVVPSAEGRAGWKTAVAVAKVAQRDLWERVAPSALYFHARHAAPAWRMTRVAAIGNHIFYR